jgi:hypothetical protein
MKAFLVTLYGLSAETDGHEPAYYPNITAEGALSDQIKVGDYVRIKGELYVVEPPNDKGKRQVHRVSMAGDK